DFSQASAGTTHVDVAGTDTTQFGLIAVTGAATLAGTFDVQFAAGFTPVDGSRFQVLDYGSHTGQFDSIHVTGLADGLLLTPEYNGTDMTLVVSATAGFAAVAQSLSVPAGAPIPQTTAGPELLGVDSS